MNSVCPNALRGASDLVATCFGPMSEKDMDIASHGEEACLMDMGLVVE